VLLDQTPPASDRRKDLFFFGLFLLLFLLTFRDFFFAGRVFFERDTSIVEIPVRMLTVTLLKEGHLALWTDAYGNGQPFLANPKNAVFYPATLLYLILPVFTAFRLFYLIHVILGWLGLYYLCRSYSLSEKAAFLGASLFAFSGMYLSSFEFYNHIAALAWTPWILLFLNREPRPGRSRLVPLVVFWTLLILAGSPETIVITALLAAAQSFLRPSAWKRRLAPAALSFTLACLLSAVQLAPSFEMLTQTGRKSQSVNWPLELLQLPNMAFPGLLGNDRQPGHHDFWGWHLFDKHFPLYYSLYMGFGALLLFLFALKRPWDRRRKVLMGSFGLFFLLACGRYSPFFFLYKMTPFLSSIRYPVKFFLGSVFCLSLLAALGFDEAVAAKGPGAKALRTLLIVAGAALGLYLLFQGRVLSFINRLMIIDKAASLREFGRSIGTGLVVLVVFAAGFAVLSAAKGRGRALAWALLVLAVLDPAFHNRWINPTVPVSFFDRPPIMNDLKPPLTVYRSEDYFIDRREKSPSNVAFLDYYRGTLYPLSGVGQGVRYVLDYDFYGTYPRRYSELVVEVKKLPPESLLKVLRFLGCTYFISDYPLFPNETTLRLEVDGFPIVAERIAGGKASPFVVHAARRAADTQGELGLFTSSEFDPHKEAVTERELARPGFEVSPAPAPTRPGVIVTKKEAQGFGSYAADLPSGGIAVFPGNYARGWRARVDGKKAEVFEADLFAKGVLVAAGKHEIVLEYLPGSLVAGAAVSLAALMILAAGAIVSRKRLRRKARLAAL
jgi:hypothetical protein